MRQVPHHDLSFDGGYNPKFPIDATEKANNKNAFIKQKHDKKVRGEEGYQGSDSRE